MIDGHERPSTGKPAERQRLRLAAAIHWAVGEDGETRRHWAYALALYAELGTPDTERIRSRLAGR